MDKWPNIPLIHVTPYFLIYLLRYIRKTSFLSTWIPNSLEKNLTFLVSSYHFCCHLSVLLNSSGICSLWAASLPTPSSFPRATCSFSGTCREDPKSLKAKKHRKQHLLKHNAKCKQFPPFLHLPTSLWLQTQAMIRGVWPMLSMAITSAPASTRISAQSRRPSAAATCSGVLPEAHLLPHKNTQLQDLHLCWTKDVLATCWHQRRAPAGTSGRGRCWVSSGRKGPCGEVAGPQNHGC